MPFGCMWLGATGEGRNLEWSLVTRRAAVAIGDALLKGAPRADSNKPPMRSGRAEAHAQWAAGPPVVAPRRGPGTVLRLFRARQIKQLILKTRTRPCDLCGTIQVATVARALLPPDGRQQQGYTG
jgi:hypothetical protein